MFCLVGLWIPTPYVAAQQIRTQMVNGYPVVANVVLVKYRTPPTAAQLMSVERLADAEATEMVGGINVYRIQSRIKDTATLLADLGGLADITYVEPDYLWEAIEAPLTVPNDPLFPSLWGLQNTGQVIGNQRGVPEADIRAVAAWTLEQGSQRVVVGVVDTGINTRHPDLVANLWAAPRAFTVSIGSFTVTCPAGSHGFNAIQRTCDPEDDHFHGTHVTGTIGATGNNQLGVVGVSPTVSLMALKFLNASGFGSTTDAINAIEFAIQVKQTFGAAAQVAVLSNSWSGDAYSQALRDAIERAAQAGMLFVAAAGNDARNIDLFPTYPAAYPVGNIIAVAATDNTDALAAAFSNYGHTRVHLGAPGVDILSTDLGTGYRFARGTSMATPHVSGAAALMLAACDLHTDRLKAVLLEHVDQIPALVGKTLTGGRLNVYRALVSCMTPSPQVGALFPLLELLLADTLPASRRP
jgi:subtilisin family serine protease